MKQQGFILLVALIFLFLMSTLSLSVLSNSHLQVLAIKNFALTNEQLRALEAGVLSGEHRLQREQPLPSLPYYLKPWESKEYFLIRYNQWDVHYIIDELPAGANCLMLAGRQSEAGAFYRITAWLSADYQPSPLLQTVYAGTTGGPCKVGQTMIRPGRLSWREFYI